MWFNILKEDGDALWNQRVYDFFIKALEEIFDEVVPDNSPSGRDVKTHIKQRYDDTYLSATIYIAGPLYSNQINFVWVDALELHGNLDVRYKRYIEGKRGFETGTFKNVQELIDNLKVLDRKLMLYLTKPDIRGHPRMGEIIKDVMGW